MKKYKCIFIVLLILSLICLISNFLPITKNNKDIVLSNIEISDGVSQKKQEEHSCVEILEDFANEGAQFGYDYFDFKKIYYNQSQYKLYVLSFEIYNGTSETIGINDVISYDKNGMYVCKYISNAEKVYIAPGDSDLVSVVVYIDESLSDVDSLYDVIIGNIEKITFVQSETNSNLVWFFKEKISSRFFVHSASIKDVWGRTGDVSASNCTGNG